MRTRLVLFAAVALLFPLSMTTPALAVPANDDFVDAEVLTGLSDSATGTNVDATSEDGEPNHDGRVGGASIWYRWTAPSNGLATISLCASDFDTLLGIYTGGAVGALTGIASDDDGCADSTRSTVSFIATAGTVYRIAVDGWGGTVGTVALQLTLAAAPANDDFADAAVLTGTSDSTNGTTIGATEETGEPNHGGNPGGVSVWYRWQAPSHGQALVDVCTADFDTLVGVYTGSGVNALTPVATNTEGCYDSLLSFNAVSGTVYRIAVDGYLGEIGTFTLQLALGADLRPANDDFPNAAVLTGTSDSATGTTDHATKEAGEPDHAGVTGGVSVWYRWTAPHAETVVVDTCESTADTLLAVYTGTTVAALTEVTSNDEGDADCGGQPSLVTFEAAAGTTYRIAVDGKGGWEGAIQVHLQLAPANDDFAHAVVLTGESDSATTSNAGATMQAGEPDHGALNSADASIWYRWTAPKIGQVMIDTCGSAIDTVLAVYTGTAVNALTRTAANGDACGEQSRVSFETTTGTVYRIAVAGESWSAEGTISLHVNLGPAFGYLQVAPSVDFGRVAVGKTATKTVTLRNVGHGPLTITSVGLRKYAFASTEYTIAIDEATGTTIPPGGSRRMVLRFTPAGNASGAPRPVEFFNTPSGFALLKATYKYSSTGVNVATRVWHYVRNAGGTGATGYRVTAVNDYGAGFAVKGSKQGTVSLRAGEYYAVEALSPYASWAYQSGQQLFSPSNVKLSTQVFGPMWPATTVSAFSGVESVAFRRMGDAILVIRSSDPTPQSPGNPYRFAPEINALTGVKVLGEARAVCPDYAADPRNQIVGTASNDTLTGSTGRDIICGLGGNDMLLGRGGDDLLIGGPGRDTLKGEAGDDVLRANDGVADVVNGGTGRDTGVVDRVDTVTGIEVKRSG